MKRAAIFVLVLMLLLSGVSAAGAATQKTEILTTKDGILHRTVLQDSRSHRVRYRFPNGDTYQQVTAFSRDGSMVLDFPAASCTVRYSDPDSSRWTVLYDPAAVTLKRTMFLDFDTGSAIFSPPQAYEEMEHGCLRSLPRMDGTLHLTKTDSGWRVTIHLPLGRAQWNWFCLTSDAGLINWESPFQKELWLDYQMTDTYRWCTRGMYQLAPDSYFPTGEDVYFRNPATYIPVKFITTGGSRAADDLGVAMLDCVRREVNADGYIPISTQSSWLKEDFGIGHGYYDTRWSTDLAEGLYLAAEKFGIEEFSRSVQQYADFLCRHTEAHRGILPPDYTWDGRHKTTHASLNHLLAEALLLYHADRKPEADALVAAICEKDWLRPDGNLKYGLMPDGTEIGTDYPFLTYNDLYKLRQYLWAKFPIQLQQLMDSKLTWMQKNGVSGYLE